MLRKIRAFFAVSILLFLHKELGCEPTFSPICKDKNELPLVVIIPSYNNSLWFEKCLNSVLSQKYENFRVIFIDDCSTDGMGKLVANYLEKHPLGNRVQFIRNKKRHLKMFNLYRAVQSCSDDEIIVELDGDDWYADENVLALINSVYLTYNVWMTYGNNQKFPPRQITNPLQPIPSWAIETNAFRSLTEANIQVQLRTFRAWLFKQIKLEDLFFEGHFVSMSADSAIMLPMYEMAGEKFKFIETPIYVQNLATNLNDHKVDGGLQTKIDKHIRMRPCYKKIDQPVQDKKTANCDVVLFLSNKQSVESFINQITSKVSGINNIFACTTLQNSTIKSVQFVHPEEILKTVLLSDTRFFAIFADVPDQKINLNEKIDLCYCFKASGFNTKARKKTFKSCNLPYERVAKSIYAYRAGSIQDDQLTLDCCVLDKNVIGLSRGRAIGITELKNILSLENRVFLFEK